MSYKYYKYFFHWKSSPISSICEQIVVTSSVHLMNNWPTRTSLKRMICLQITSFLNNHECTKESKGECVNFQWIMTIFMFEAWHCQSSCAFIISKMFKHPFVFHRKKTVIQVWNNMSKWWVNNAIFWGWTICLHQPHHVNSIWLQMSLKCDVYDLMPCLCSYVISDIWFSFSLSLVLSPL